MPVVCSSTTETSEKMVCESNLSGAIRESLQQQPSSSTSGGGNDEVNVQDRLVAYAKRLLFTNLEYEEAPTSSTGIYENIKSKYTVLKPNSGVTVHQNGSIEVHKNGIGVTITSGKGPSLPQPKRILFPISEVHIGWKSLGRRWNIGSGMINMGNTCYLNSTLQALFHVPSVASWLITDSAHRERCSDLDGNGCIICAMAKTLILSQSNMNAIRPQIVYSKLKLICRHLVPGRQEDAHEFLRYLVEAMEKAYLNRFKNWKELDQHSKETTPLNQILGGYLRSAVRCLSCQHVSVTFQHFEDLLLDIRKANSVEEAVELYFSRERLEDTGYKCEACKKRVSATKQFTIERAPIALCVQLKRFSMLGTKLNKQIAMKPRLVLTQYSSNKRSDVKLEYKLVSLVTHIGASQHCGHYTAIGCTESGTYYHFDDSNVRPISIQSVLDTQAYLLFYELIDDSAFSSNGAKQEVDMFADLLSSPVIRKTTTNGTPSKIIPPERKPGFIGPLMPQKNGVCSVNSQTVKATNSKLVNNILSGSKVMSLSSKPGTSGLSTASTSNGTPSPVKKPQTQELNGTTTPPQSPNKRLATSILPHMPRLSPTEEPIVKPLAAPLPKITSPVPSTSKHNGFCTNTSLNTSTNSGTKPKSLVPAYSDESDSETGTDRSHDVVKTKTGLWTVSDTSDRPSLQGSTDTSIHPVSAPSTPTSSHSIDSPYNTIQKNEKLKRSMSENDAPLRRTDPVSHLLKQSHRGYGSSNVQTWNGETSSMQKEIYADKHEERKRQYEEDCETEMDRGRTKKVKLYRDDDRSKSRYDHNPFQAYQNRENNSNSMNRVKWISNNSNNNHSRPFYHGNKSFTKRSNNFQQRNFNSGHNRHGYNKHKHRYHPYNTNNRYNNHRDHRRT